MTPITRISRSKAKWRRSAANRRANESALCAPSTTIQGARPTTCSRAGQRASRSPRADRRLVDGQPGVAQRLGERHGERRVLDLVLAEQR